MNSRKFYMGLLLILTNAFALATPPRTISFQGTITDGDGNPPPDDTYQITFSFWDTQTAGFELWTETQDVQLTSGRFNVMLGSIQPPDPNVFDGGSAWLQVQFEGDTPMMPRTMITGVPFSTQTQRVEGDVQTGDGFLLLHPPGPDASQTIVLSTDNTETNMLMVNPGPPDNSINMTADGSGSSLLMVNPGPPEISLGLTADTDNARLSFNGNPGPPDMELRSNPSEGSHIFVWDPQADLGLSIGVDDDSSSLVMVNPGPPDNSIGLRSDANGSVIQLLGANPGPPEIFISADASASNLVMVSPGPPDNSINMRSDGNGSSLVMTNPGPPEIQMQLQNAGDSALFEMTTQGERVWTVKYGAGLSKLMMENPLSPNNSLEMNVGADDNAFVLNGAPGIPAMEIDSRTAGDTHLIIWDSQADLGMAMNVDNDSSSLVMYNPGPPENSIGFKVDATNSAIQLFGFNPGPPNVAISADASSSSLSMLNPTLPAIQMNMANGGTGAALSITDTEIPILTVAYDGTDAWVSINDPGRSGSQYLASAAIQGYLNSSGDLLARLEPSGFTFVNPGEPYIGVNSLVSSSDGKLGVYLDAPGEPPIACAEFDFDGTAANLVMINPGPPESYSLNASFSQTYGRMSFINSAGSETVRFDGDGNGFLSGNLGIGPGTSAPSNILTVEMESDTDPIADAWTTYSSRRWKKNIKTVDNALDKVERLRGVTFDWKADGRHDIGLIAEEVGEVIPEVVAYEENGVDAKSIDYARLVSVLIEAVKEQQTTIADLQNRVTDLTRKYQQFSDRQDEKSEDGKIGGYTNVSR